MQRPLMKANQTGLTEADEKGFAHLNTKQ